MSDYIKKPDCKDRVLYRIHSRNLTFGVYDQETGGFNGIREKFGQLYVFREYHYDNGAPFGTVLPLEELPEHLPSEIENVERLSGSWCSSCHKPVEYVKEPRTVTYPDGETLDFPGRWKHVDPADSVHGEEFHAFTRENKRLFDWLKSMESKYAARLGV